MCNAHIIKTHIKHMLKDSVCLFLAFNRRKSVQIKQKKLIFEKIINVFAWLSLFLAIIFSTVAVFASFSGEQNGKEVFGHKLLIVNTDSMSKSATSKNEKIFFEAGDVIVIKIIDNPNSLKVGDVITFFSYNPESMGKTVSHKIREIKYSTVGEITGIVTYGINTGVNDLVEVKPEHLIGKYVFKIPNVGHLFSFLQTPRGFYLSILIPGVLLIIFFSVKIGKVLGRREYNKIYEEEMESLKERLASLEERRMITMEEKTQQVLDENAEQTGQPMVQAEQATGQAVQMQPPQAVYQTVSINYQPTPFAPPPVIYQTAPKQGVPIYQTITINPMQSIPVGEITQAQFIQQPIICQTIGDNVPSIPAPICCKAFSGQGEQVVNEAVEQTVATKDVVESAYEKIEEDGEEFLNDKLNIPEAQKKPFTEKMVEAKKETQGYFNLLHNELASYKKVSSRVSLRCASYRKGRTLLAKITIKGKTLMGFFNLPVKDFNENVFFQKDKSNVKAYQEVPFAVKIKSERACNNAIKLVDAIAEKFELKKIENFKPTDQIKQFKKNK